jgi:hypothetical protein
MKKLITLCIFLLSGALAVSGQSKYEVTLTGLDQIPRVNTPAMGFVEVWVESDTLYVSGTFEDLRSYYWSGFIHFGKKGEAGNRLYRLKASDFNEEKNSGVFHPEDNKFPMRPAQKEALRNGHLYINIASNRHQQGEIRGQIPPMQ